MSKTNDLQQTLYDAQQILERAFLIVPAAPFHMRADEEYAKLTIDGDEATLIWPEYTSDYYGGGYLECQSVSFPSELLLMSVDEIKAWKKIEQEKYEAEERVKAKLYTEARARQQEDQERSIYSMLKAKFG